MTAKKTEREQQTALDSLVSRFWKIYEYISLLTIQQIGIGASVILAVLIAGRPTTPVSILIEWLLRPGYHLILRTVGTAIGFGFGLGLATHVYDQLEIWKHAERQAKEDEDAKRNKQNNFVAGGRRISNRGFGGLMNASSMRQLPAQSSSSSILRPGLNGGYSYCSSSSNLLQQRHHLGEDEQTYSNLMTAAGYTVSPEQYHLRGQVVRKDNPTFRYRLYNFAEAKITDNDDNDQSAANEERKQQQQDLPRSAAVNSMCELWPTLPLRINEELGRAIEYIIRDFVAVWYMKCDYGCKYQDPAQPKEQSNNNANSSQSQSQRMMLYSLAEYRPIPFIDNLYESMAVVFGNLATRVENVNIFELILVKWIQILAHSFKVYRMLRKNVVRISHQPKNRQQQSDMKSGDTTTTMNNSTAIWSDGTSTTSTNDATISITTAAATTTTTAGGIGSGIRVKNLGNRLASLRQNINPLGNKETAEAVPAPLAISSIQSAGGGDLDVLSDATSTSTRLGQQRSSASTSSTTTPYIPVSEIAMTKEFLFAGKLHKAVTFGLDVPSLLFADATGRECGIPASPGTATAASSLLSDAAETLLSSDNSSNHDEANNGPKTTSPEKKTAFTTKTDDEVLAHRLFDTNLIRDCELDYNRVLGARMVRSLIPRSEYSSGIVRSLLTEIMGGCVLTPIMGLFGPDYINSWIISGLAKEPDNNEEKATASTTDASVTTTTMSSLEAPSSKITINEIVEASESGEGATDNVEVIVSTNSTEGESTNVTSLEILEDGIKTTANNVVATESGTGKNDSDGAASSDVESHVISAPNSASNLQVNTDYSESLHSAGGQFASVDTIVMQLARALIDLQNFVDFDEIRNARMSNVEYPVDWDSPDCRAAVLRLVLVIEAALTHGRCTYKPRLSRSSDDEDEEDINSVEDGQVCGDGLGDGDDQGSAIEGNPIEVTLPEYESVTFSQILMELTSDIDAFEERVEAETNSEQEKFYANKLDGMVAEAYQPTPQEQSTMRTLIAAWLHTGQVFRAVSLLTKAHATILAPYYHQKAFLRTTEHSDGFIRQLIALVDIDILVDTMAVLACPRLEDTDQDTLATLVARSAVSGGGHSATSQNIIGSEPKASPSAAGTALMASNQFMSTSSIPRYLDFNRNESFAASLRTERERRTSSWERIMNQEIYGSASYTEPLPIIYRSYRRGKLESDEEDIALHKDMHHVSRLFYTGTYMLAIRDAARRINNATAAASRSEGSDVSESAASSETLQQVSLITVENVSQRRRLEVPDDDSSFLLRAQPRPLNAVGVHRDQRNHDQSFKCFAATYDEPAAPGQYTGGRYIRRCLVKYYPIDRTSSVALQNEPARKLDQRKGKNSVPDTITVGQSMSMSSSGRLAPFLSNEFLRERHLCQRWVPKGTARTQSILASNVVEPNDFTLIPRSGKAIDFIYRMNFYERPMLDLGGKHFTIHDSASLGTHRADASSLEISDATISLALLLLGSDEKPNSAGDADASPRPMVEMGKDGYPVLWMKFSRKQDDSQVEVKPYRTSFVRAALFITAARQEAQLQCLIKCVRDGSAKQASKALTDAYLKSTLKLLEYASSRNREKQSMLLRDLKLGINHIDQGQLRRNGLLLPRYPTSLLDLTASVDDVVQSTDVKGVNNIFGAASTVFRIRCIATVTLIASDDELEGDYGYRSDDGILGKIFREEWVIYRTMKEFQAFHKHLKAEVSTAESSGTAGSRLVGAATAAFAATNALPGRQRQKKMLIPSLAQAPKTGALGGAKKLNAKRKEILDAYLGYLLAPGHLMGQCSELLLFLGAFYPFPTTARVGATIHGEADPLGRTEMTRTILHKRLTEPMPKQVPAANATPPLNRSFRAGVNSASSATIGTEGHGEDEVMEDIEEQEEKGANKIYMIPSIKCKIDKVQLAQVRNILFELLRYQFGFENASFIRNRMLQALKTASFAITSPSEFRRTLYKVHVEYVNSEALAGWVKVLSDLLWPGGIFFTSSPPMSIDELKTQADKAKEALHSSFPSEVRAILGQELTRDGVDILHEMLQNRLVIKSMAYMLFDLLWLEVFPEIGDILPCGAALDIDK